MMKKILILIFLSCCSLAYSGTESGGGGGVVWIESRPILMDYFTMVDSVEDLPSLAKHREKNIDSREAFTKAKRILDQWSKLHFEVMNFMLKTALTGSLEWNFVDESLSAPPFYLSPSIPADSKVEVAAYYEKNSSNKSQVLLNRPIWNQLDLDGQTGLVLHEALRQMQIGFKHGFNDQSLQRATAIYLMCHPSNRLNYYMFYILSNSPESADKIYGPFQKFIESECKRIE